MGFFNKSLSREEKKKKLTIRSYVMRFSSLLGKPSMRNLLPSLDSISLWISLMVISEGTIFPFLILLRIMALKIISKNHHGTITQFHSPKGTQFPYPFSLLDNISFLNRSPALRWVKPKVSAIFAHCVPFPLPGPPENISHNLSRVPKAIIVVSQKHHFAQSHVPLTGILREKNLSVSTPHRNFLCVPSTKRKTQGFNWRGVREIKSWREVYLKFSKLLVMKIEFFSPHKFILQKIYLQTAWEWWQLGSGGLIWFNISRNLFTNREYKLRKNY